jgi:hypothetical protein
MKRVRLSHTIDKPSHDPIIHGGFKSGRDHPAPLCNIRDNSDGNGYVLDLYQVISLTALQFLAVDLI